MTKSEDTLLSMPNIGENAAKLLAQVGITTPAELKRVGSVEAAFRIKSAVRGESPCRSMLSGLEGSTLGVWISHGEGKFHLPYTEARYNIVGTYGYQGYPANPNGSDYNTAMLCDDSGRHLVTMPHIERSIFPSAYA